RRAGPVVVRQSGCHRALSSPLRPGNGSDAEPVPHLRRVAPALEPAGELAEIFGKLDFKRDQLVTATAALLREALALEPKDLARARPRRDRQHDRSVDGGHLDL